MRSLIHIKAVMFNAESQINMFKELIEWLEPIEDKIQILALSTNEDWEDKENPCSLTVYYEEVPAGTPREFLFKNYIS